MASFANQYDRTKKQEAEVRQALALGRKAAQLDVRSKVTDHDLDLIAEASKGLNKIVRQGEDQGLGEQVKPKPFGMAGRVAVVAGLELALGPAAILFEGARAVSKGARGVSNRMSQPSHQSFAAESDGIRGVVAPHASARRFNYADFRPQPQSQSADGTMNSKHYNAAAFLERKVSEKAQAVGAGLSNDIIDLTRPGAMTDRALNSMSGQTIDRVVEHNGFGSLFDTGYVSKKAVDQFANRMHALKPHQMMALAPGFH